MKIIEELKKVIESTQSEKCDSALNQKLTYLIENFIQSDIVTLFVYDEETKYLYQKLYYNRETNDLKYIDNTIALSMVNPQGCIGKVFLTKAPAIYNYIVSDRDYVESYDNIHGHRLKSQMLLPVIENDVLRGIVCMSTVIHGKLQRYTNKELALLQSAEPYFMHIINKLTLSTGLTDDVSIDPSLDEDMTQKVKQQTVVNDDSMLLFLSNTVHDIRTPANSLYGFLELLEDKLEDKRLKEFVTNAKESASFINTLTTSILDTAKNRYESTLSELKVVCPEKFLSDIANTFSAKILEKQIHYFIYISPNIPKEIKVDTIKLQRVLVNLIGNAYKFTPVKEEIYVTMNWNAPDTKIELSVRDTGIGIEKKDQEKLFKAFSQATDKTQEKYGGTGLGLAISAGYVSDLGGELKLKSEFDVGSEFYFDIPVEVVDKAPKYMPFYNFDKKIVILTDYIDAKYPSFIRQYLVDFGMPEEKIVISNTIEKETTHVICFEEKISSKILNDAKNNFFKLLLIEQSLFSLLHKNEMNHFKITSKNVYNGEAIHSTVYSGNKVRVLIVDDNKINISLLEAMLEVSYVDVSSCDDAQKAMQMLKSASEKNQPYDVLYLDKHMPGISGTEMLQKLRSYEEKHHLKPIYAVSISGDPDISDNERELFDALVTKPFNKQEVRGIIEAL